MTITPLSTVYLNGDTFSASDINATNTNVNLVTATQSLISAKGDILAGTADDTLGRTAVGANDTILTADSAQTNGVKWSATFAGNSATATTATTATALQTARTIGGVSFDGTANINLAGVNTTGNQNTSGSSASCTGNSATATALQTARTIGGVSFDGTGNINLAGVNTTGNQNTSGTSADSNLLNGVVSTTAGTANTIVKREGSGGVIAYDYEATNNASQFYSTTIYTSLGDACARVKNGYPVYDELITTRAVYINASGTLGTLSSSRVYKENIVEYHDATNKLLTLNPVTFDFREEFIEEGDDRFNHFGLIAEDVHDAGLTHLVSYNAEGKPKAVDYTMLSVELLGIVKKQQTAIDDLLARVQALETN